MKAFLAIDTASVYCSVALSHNDNITVLKQESAQSHAAHILSMVDALLDQNNLVLQQIDGIVVNNGPGSFTGLRIGLSVAQGLAYAHDLPVASVSSLAALTEQCDSPQEALILPLIDARMQEIYGALYWRKNGLVTTLVEPLVAGVQTYIEVIQTHANNQTVYCLGNALAEYSQLSASFNQSQLPIEYGDAHAVSGADDILHFFINQYVKNQQLDSILMDAKLLIPQYVRNNVTS